MNRIVIFLCAACVVACSAQQSAADTVVLDSSSAFAVGAVADGSTSQLGSGSWKGNGGATSDIQIYMSPDGLSSASVANMFGCSILVSEIASISWFTNKAGSEGSADWSLNIYTSPDGVDDDAGWYGRRLSSEPMHSYNRSAPSHQWNRWQTGTGGNQLTFYDSNRTRVGVYGGPTLSDITGGAINWGDYATSESTDVVDYSQETVRFIKLGTSTGGFWNGFEGSVDNFTITLTDGSSSTVDFESAAVAPTPSAALAGLTLLGGVLLRRSTFSFS